LSQEPDAKSFYEQGDYQQAIALLKAKIEKAEQEGDTILLS
jgi:hypothetical protein